MDTRKVRLRDVQQGRPQSRARLLAPLRYLYIYHPEKTRYDFVVPSVVAVCLWLAFSLAKPEPQIFGSDGLLRFVRDFLIMGVPFLFSALAAVAMGTPGEHLNHRPPGVELYLDNRLLTLRAFVCYQLGYLCFVGLVTLVIAVGAGLFHDTVLAWTAQVPAIRDGIRSFGVLALSFLLSSFSVTTLWALYFLTDTVNRP